MRKPSTTFINEQYARTNHSLLNHIQPYRMDCNAQCQIAKLANQKTRLYKLKYRYKPKKITDEAPNLKQLQIKRQSHITLSSPANIAESVFCKMELRDIQKTSAAIFVRCSYWLCVFTTLTQKPLSLMFIFNTIPLLLHFPFSLFTKRSLNFRQPITMGLIWLYHLPNEYV